MCGFRKFHTHLLQYDGEGGYRLSSLSDSTLGERLSLADEKRQIEQKLNGVSQMKERLAELCQVKLLTTFSESCRDFLWTRTEGHQNENSRKVVFIKIVYWLAFLPRLDAKIFSERSGFLENRELVNTLQKLSPTSAKKAMKKERLGFLVTSRYSMLLLPLTPCHSPQVWYEVGCLIWRVPFITCDSFYMEIFRFVSKHVQGGQRAF